MNKPSGSLEKLLDPSAAAALPQILAELREALLARATWTAKGEKIAEEDLNLAYEQLRFPHEDSLQFSDAQAVISQALRENRILEWVSYGMAVVLFIFGLFLLSVGTISQDSATRIGALIGGSIVELLILLPFRFAINSRRHNIALRMLGVILNRVDDPKKIAPLLKDTFLAVVMGTPPFRVRDDA